VSVVYGRGRLTDADKQRIFELHSNGMGPCRIARAIKRHPATVNWFMYRTGLRAPRYHANRPQSYVRNGRTVRAFSPEEDAFITALRIQDFGFTEIARLANQRFGTERGVHTIHCRLVMLAAREDEA
jgi:IS30 family transposase